MHIFNVYVFANIPPISVYGDFDMEYNWYQVFKMIWIYNYI